MRDIRKIIRSTALVAAVAVSPALMADCQVAKLGTLPVEIENNRPFIDGQINGYDMYVLADTGAALSLIWAGVATQAGLRPATVDGRVYGLSGSTGIMAVNIDELKLGDYTVRGKRWPVIGDRADQDSNVGMILGSDVLSKLDVEFDLANGQITLWDSKNCEKAPLARWSRDFMLAELAPSREGMILSDVRVNGTKVRAMLDTGAEHTVMSIELARKLGFDEDAADVKAGPPLDGVGRSGDVPSYIARFDTFEMGDLTVRNARLLVSDMQRHVREANTGSRIGEKMEFIRELIIGADFFRANHVLVANSQHLLYFTYNGGTIFNVGETPAAARPDGAGN